MIDLGIEDVRPAPLAPETGWHVDFRCGCQLVAARDDGIGSTFFGWSGLCIVHGAWLLSDRSLPLCWEEGL